MVLLIVLLSVIVFWMSTQQSTLLIRLPIWISGAGLLLLAAALSAQAGGHDAAIAALADAWSNRDDPTDNVLFSALSSNAPTVRRYVAPLVGLLIVFAGVLGVFALLALTPGQFLERAFVRPLAMGMIGATAGAGLALAVVAIAFGGPVQLNRYVGYVDPANAAQIYDGDTFWLGDVSVRLLDIDAPELRQSCRRADNTKVECGVESRRMLAALVNDTVVDCAPQAGGQSYGRPLVSCAIRRRGDDRVVTEDLAQEMVRAGMAVVSAQPDTPSSPALEGLQDLARAQRLGLWASCTLAPAVWREDDAARRRFEATGEVPAETSKTVGDCSRQTKVAS